MAEIYDNWERLVEATLRREQLRLYGLRTPSDLSTASSSPQRLFDSLTVCTLRLAVDNKTLVWLQGRAPNILVDLAKLMLPTASDKKKRALKIKVLRTAISLPGVCEVGLEGEERNHLVVKGYAIDAVMLTLKLRKKVAYAELLSIAPARNDDLTMFNQ